MKNIDLKITVEHLSMDELNEEERHLVETAIAATNNSYAKYSHFHVGAALLMSDGSVIIGANQENAVFPVGLCAERTAIFAAQAQHPELSMKMLAIAARNKEGLVRMPVSPCGSCRQVILEMEERYQQPIRILLYGTEGVYAVRSVRDLLPLCFMDESMR
ncbi:MAG: cytidine deaminase [Prevotella sp.]|nr:cytidine deaminase [Prevotella sp.]